MLHHTTQVIMQRRHIIHRCLANDILTPTDLVRSHLLDGIRFDVVCLNDNVGNGVFLDGHLAVQIRHGVFRRYARLADVMKYFSLSRSMATSHITVDILRGSLRSFCMSLQVSLKTATYVRRMDEKQVAACDDM